MENKVCILIPYFGKFNNYFNLWAYSASKNNRIDFYIITDLSSKRNIPGYPNLHFINSSLDEIKSKFSLFFGFECCLDKPYKLCDYKPFYFILYPEILKKYDFWGFGDIDLIYGDILSLLPKELNEYDVYFQYGHLQLIKNSPEINNLVLKYAGADKIREVYSTNKPCFFDEREFSRFNLAKKANLRVYDNQDLIGDIYSYSPVLRLVRNYKTDQTLLFVFNNGKLIGYEKNSSRFTSKEYIYIHLQKRKMSNCAHNMNQFMINGYKFFNSRNNKIDCIFDKYAYKNLISKYRIFTKLRLKPKLSKFFNYLLKRI